MKVKSGIELKIYIFIFNDEFVKVMGEEDGLFVDVEVVIGVIYSLYLFIMYV